LLYGIEIYANTYLSYLHDLMVLNNRILRILQHKPYNSDTNDLYLAYSTLSIDKLFQLQILSQAHTLIFNPTILSPSFQHTVLNHNIHNHSTRSRFDFHRFPSTSLYARKISSNLCSRLWNALPSDIKTISNSKLFRYTAREFQIVFISEGRAFHNLEQRLDDIKTISNPKLFRYTAREFLSTGTL